MNRALLIGINSYPGSPLRGCENDVNDLAAILKSQYEFSVSEIKIILNDAATKRTIAEALNGLVDGISAGDRVFFHYSGHGTTMVSGQDVVDSICPVDFDFSLDTAITALDFAKLFGSIPDGVEFNWSSDSCYSGDLTRELLPPDAVPRYLTPPDAVQQQINEIMASPRIRLFRFRSTAPLNGGFISGCGPSETSADAKFQGRFNGAFTYFLLKELETNPNNSLGNLCSAIVHDLRSNRPTFSQTPSVKGAASVTGRPFLGGTSTPAALKFASVLAREYTRELQIDITSRGEIEMTDVQPQKTLREVLATDGDLRRKAQRAAVEAWYSVIKEAGYSFTALDREEIKTDLTATAIALSDSSDSGTRDDLGSVIVAAGVGVAIASGGF